VVRVMGPTPGSVDGAGHLAMIVRNSSAFVMQTNATYASVCTVMSLRTARSRVAVPRGRPRLQCLYVSPATHRSNPWGQDRCARPKWRRYRGRLANRPRMRAVL
jgi:hypothetical protein